MKVKIAALLLPAKAPDWYCHACRKSVPRAAMIYIVIVSHNAALPNSSQLATRRNAAIDNLDLDILSWMEWNKIDWNGIKFSLSNLNILLLCGKKLFHCLGRGGNSA